MVTIGLDIGGANLKAALPFPLPGRARSSPFPLWRQPEQLEGALRRLVEDFPAPDLLAVTMTGELCDCFASKREGVLAILAAVSRAFPGVRMRVWTAEGRFSDPADLDPLQAAAANWLALASYAGRFAPEGPALLIDVGSTTTDLVPLQNGVPVPAGRTDSERLRCGELVYTGVRRTPLCALMGGEGAAEFFATTQDVYLVLGLVPESDATDTADGRPASVEAAQARLARMLCSDLESSSAEDRLGLARRLAERQEDLIRDGLARVLTRLSGPPQTVILAGEGEFLAERVVPLGARVVRLEEELGAETSRAACAQAVAVLARGPSEPAKKTPSPWHSPKATPPTRPPSPLLVAKVGGSLFNLPDLASRLRSWLAAQDHTAFLLVPGGGPTADVIRDLDARHALGQEAAHWLALRSLTVNAHFLARLFQPLPVLSQPGRLNGGAILDPHAFVLADEGRPGSLPHHWDVTSDSVALRVAQVLGAEELVLLKSEDLPPGLSWEEAGRRGFVDPAFPRLLGQVPGLRVRVCNLRAPPERNRGAWPPEGLPEMGRDDTID